MWASKPGYACRQPIHGSVEAGCICGKPIYPPPSFSAWRTRCFWGSLVPCTGLVVVAKSVGFGSSLGAGNPITGAGPMVDLHHFFRDHLGPPSTFFRFCCQLGPNLPPNLGPKSSQNRSKCLPKSIPKPHLNFDRFLIDFNYFRSIYYPKTLQKSIKNHSTNHPNNTTTKKHKCLKNMFL